MLPYAGISPRFTAPLAHAGAGSAVLGRVTLGANAWLGALSVLRADGHVVRVGDDGRIGPRSTLHINEGIYPCSVGDRVAVGENACVHACTVGSDVVIGDGAIVLDGAVLADNIVLEAGAIVYPNKRLGGGYLYAGAPATAVRFLREGEVAARREAMILGPDGEARAATGAVGASCDIDPSAFIAATASLRGRLIAAAGSSIWYSTDLDAGSSVIAIGERTNIQDNTLIHCSTERGVSLGRDAVVGHNATIHDCVIGNEVLIGIGSTVAVGTMIQDRVLLAAGARTQPGQELQSGWLYAGTPARKRAPLGADKQAMIRLIVRQYCAYARDFQELQHERAGRRA